MTDESVGPSPAAEGTGRHVGPSGPGRDRPARTVERVSGTSPRPTGLRRSPLLMRISMVVWAVGAVTILAMMFAFASGARSFPLWVWLLASLVPIGFALGALRIKRAGDAVGGG